MFYGFVQGESHCWSRRTFPHFESSSLVAECFGDPSQRFKSACLCLTEHPELSNTTHDCKKNPTTWKWLLWKFVKVFLSSTDRCVFGFASNPLLCGLQVLINHSETKDGSGGPLDYEDLESGDLVFPRDPAELERTFPEPTEHQSVIVVRQRNHCGSVFVRAALHCRVKACKSRPLII